MYLVSVLVIVAIISIPILVMDGNKFLKHALEWDYFVGVISFYLLTFFMWKKIK
jgi:Zn-dependent protease